MAGPLLEPGDQGASDPLHIEKERHRKQGRDNTTDQEDQNEDRSAPHRSRRIAGYLFVHCVPLPGPNCFTEDRKEFVAERRFAVTLRDRISLYK
jgi:hypothetical protein